MNPVGLIRLETELEYGVELRGDVIPVTETNAADVPRLTVARHDDGYLLLFASTLPPGARAALAAVDERRLFESLSEIDANLLDNVQKTVRCSWYVIGRIPALSEFPDVVERDGRFVIERDGQIVADAWSAQRGERADEVEVETAEAYRRRGYGRQVVAAWTRHVRSAGKIALYSHLVTNDASRALAASVGAQQYAETVEYF
ncbi:MAG: GNAT family N-acetyltransferase [Nitrolancea sp.]